MSTRYLWIRKEAAAMSEPKSEAKRLREILPGVHGWHVMDERIDARSDAYAVVDGASVVLIDPLPLSEGARRSLLRLGRVDAICLTGSCHQRSAWRLRDLLGAKVLAPRASAGLEAAPDVLYEAGQSLPGGLRAIHAPGPTESHFTFHRAGGGGVLFSADVLVHLERGRVRFVQDEYQDDPSLTRATARRLLDLPFRTLCPAHGAPVTAGAKQAVRDGLAGDMRR